MYLNRILRPSAVTDSRKCVDWAAIASAAGSAISSIWNSSAQGSMNKRAEKYNRWALDQQMKFATRSAFDQRQWTEKMVDAENAYNSPVEQRKRLEAAGLNPYLAMTGDAGNQQGFGSGAAAAEVSPLSWSPQAPQIDTSFIPSIVSSFAQAKKSTAEADNIYYNLNRNKGLDAAGAFDAELKEKLAHADNAFELAKQQKNNTLVSDLTALWLQAPAIDENGAPVLNDDGSAVTNFDYNQDLSQSTSAASLSKIYNDILNGHAEYNLKDIQTAREKYALDNLDPQTFRNLQALSFKYKSEIAVLKGTLDVQKSEIQLNHSTATKAQAEGELSRSNKAIVDSTKDNVMYKSYWDYQKAKADAKKSQRDFNSSSYINTIYGLDGLIWNPVQEFKRSKKSPINAPGLRKKSSINAPAGNFKNRPNISPSGFR